MRSDSVNVQLYCGSNRQLYRRYNEKSENISRKPTFQGGQAVRQAKLKGKYIIPPDGIKTTIPRQARSTRHPDHD